MTQNETKKNRDLRDIIIFIIMVLLALTAVIVSYFENKKDRDMCKTIESEMRGSAFSAPSIATDINWSPKYRKETFCGHTYVIRMYDSQQMVHDPDCACHEKKVCKNTQN